MYIIGGLSIAVTALAGYVVKLHAQINSNQESRIKYMQDQVDLLRTIKKEFDKD